jgi:hypothetical protein
MLFPAIVTESWTGAGSARFGAKAKLTFIVEDERQMNSLAMRHSAWPPYPSPMLGLGRRVDHAGTIDRERAMHFSVRKFAFAAALAGGLSAVVVPPASAGGYYGDGYGWGRHYHSGNAWAGAAAAGLLGGLALGAIASSSQYPAYYSGYGYPAPACYLVDQPITDEWGDVLEYRRVRVCN